MTEPEPLQQTDRTYVRFRNRKLSYYSGCDYFRLASHPKVIAALKTGVEKYGLNVAASRLTTGNHALYGQLEKALARFFNAEDALLVPTGYLTNLVAAQALARTFSHAIIDQDSHPSLLDAARFLDCPVLQFNRREPGNLARAVRRCGPKARLILLTEGMFSRDGSAAPLDEYLQVLPRDARILVDDAHAAGVFGKSGKGSVEHSGVSRQRIIQTITLSKAFGAFGGAILANPRLRQRILDHSQLFVGSTPLPLPLANAALESVRILGTDKTLRAKLRHNTAYLKQALLAAGLLRDQTPGPIVAFSPMPARTTSRLTRELLAAAIYPPFIKYPGGPASGYFRFVISSEHTRAQLDRLLGVLIPILKSASGTAPAF